MVEIYLWWCIIGIMTLSTLTVMYIVVMLLPTGVAFFFLFGDVVQNIIRRMCFLIKGLEYGRR